MNAKSVGEVAVKALSDFASEKLSIPGPWLEVLAELVSLGVVAAIDEANTARVSGDILVVKDGRS